MGFRGREEIKRRKVMYDKIKQKEIMNESRCCYDKKKVKLRRKAGRNSFLYAELVL